MGMYPGHQPLTARLFKGRLSAYKDESLKDLEYSLFPTDPELYARIAFQRGEGIPGVYRKAAAQRVDPKMVFFESNVGRQCAGNPRYIYERMLERCPDFTFVWGYDEDPANIPGDATVVKRGCDEYYELLAQSKYLVNNTTFPLWFHREESFYLQTWHGTPYKCLHWDRTSDKASRSTTGAFFVKSTGWNALLAPNTWTAERFKSCFRYRGKILDLGYPANDIFFDEQRYEATRKRVREAFGIPADAPVYLYAPTWRDGQGVSRALFRFNLLLDPQAFIDNAPSGSYLLVRAHHMSAAEEALATLPDRVLDASGWDDPHEIMCAADVMVADYSSIVHDWYCSRKPVVYFIPDYERYLSLRDVYYDMTEKSYRAGEICYDQDQLHEAISTLDCHARTNYDEFFNRFCSTNDGAATDRSIDFLLSQ